MLDKTAYTMYYDINKLKTANALTGNSKDNNPKREEVHRLKGFQDKIPKPALEQRMKNPAGRAVIILRSIQVMQLYYCILVL